MKSKISVAAAILATVLSVAAIAVAVTQPTVSNNRATVLFVGDSNITLSSGAIVYESTWADHKNATYTPAFSARPGAGLRTSDCPSYQATPCPTYNYWSTRLPQVLSQIQPSAVVVNLGVNDTICPGPDSQPCPTTISTSFATQRGYAYYGLKIKYMMSLLPASKSVYWTTLPCTIINSSRLTGCKTVNAALRSAEASGVYPNLHIVNWDVLANSHPEWMSSGGIHYSPAGQTALADAILVELDKEFPAP